MDRILLIGVSVLFLAAYSRGQTDPPRGAERIDLAGSWRFALDPGDTGIGEEWFRRDLPDTIRLPGSLQEQGWGEVPSLTSRWSVNGSYVRKVNKIEQFRPYVVKNGLYRQSMWWTPDRLYVGAAWYQRDVEVPAGWQGTGIRLHLERVHWETRLWIDDKPAGMRNSISAPQEYELSHVLTPGRHRLTLRVDNRIKDINIGIGGHNISDHTQSNWNGIIGDLSLRSRSLVALESIWVETIDHAKKRVRLTFKLVNGGDADAAVRVTYQARTDHGRGHTAPERGFSTTIPARHDRTVEREYDLGEKAHLWSEFSPALYTLECDLKAAANGKIQTHSVATRFGLRRIYTEGSRLMINGRRLFLRGTLDCCIFPATGYPPTDEARWRRIFAMVKSCGLNHVRYHSWCPPRAAFAAADELGLYLQPEMTMWVRLGDGKPIDRWLFAEGQRILEAYGNHASCAFMAVGNELNQKKGSDIFGRLLRHYKKFRHGTLLTDNVRNIFTREAEYVINGAAKFYVHKLHSVRSNHTDFDYGGIVNRHPIPVITHEDGQWSTLPNLSVRTKYKGSLHPYYLDLYEDLMRARGTLDRYNEYYKASGMFQTILYKATWEAALRTRVRGVQMLDLRDFPGQGYAPVGSFDEFWESKGYITPEEYKSFCNATTMLARFPRHVWQNNQMFTASILVSHYGPEDLRDRQVRWRLVDQTDRVIGQGRFSPPRLPTGTVTTVGTIRQPFSRLARATQLRLQAEMVGGLFKNSWDLWVYPQESVMNPEEAGVEICELWDRAAEKKLAAGQNVLLVPRPESVAGNTKGSFTPIFWTRIMFTSSPVHTLGIYCDNEHPALGDFPTQTHTNWQWFDLLEHSRPLVLGALPRDFRAIVEPIDDWTRPRPLGLILEAKVGKGKLLICSIDILNDLKKRPAARQLRNSLLAYMAGPPSGPKGH